MTDPRGPWGPLAEPPHADRDIDPAGLPFRENVFMAVYDRAQSFYCITHMQGGKTNAGMFARCSVVLDKRFTEIYEPLGPMTFTSDHISLDLTGHLHAKCDDFTVDITVEPVREPIDYTQARTLPGLSKAEPMHHYQSTGTMSGTITVGDQTTHVEGGVIRDRSWGFRQEIASWVEYYATLLAFDDFDVATMKYKVRDGMTPPHGQLKGSRNNIVSESRVRRRYETGSVAELDLHLDDDTTLGLHFEVPDAQIFCPFNRPTGPEAITSYQDFVEVRTSDGAVGYGIMDQGFLRTLA